MLIDIRDIYKIYNEGKENQSQTVVAGKLIQEFHQPAKRHLDDVCKVKCENHFHFLLIGCSPRERGRKDRLYKRDGSGASASAQENRPSKPRIC